MNSSQEISVVIAAFNAEKFLSRAVCSVIDQTEAAYEIIIVDDGSRDGTFDTAQELANQYESVRALRLEKNGGPSVARNRGIEASTGQWVAILDADDAFEPGRLEILSNAITSIEDVDIVSDLLCLVEKEGEYCPDFALPNSPRRISVAEYLERSRPDLGYPDIGLLKPVIRKEFLNRVGLRYPEFCRHGEDSLFLISLLMNHGRYYVVSEHGYRYTTRPCGTSRTIVDYKGMKEANAVLRDNVYFQTDHRAKTALDIRIGLLEKLDQDYLYQLPFREKLKRGEYRQARWQVQKKTSSLVHSLKSKLLG